MRGSVVRVGRVRRVALSLLAAGTAAACVGASSPRPGQGVSFPAEDGVRLAGELRGSGPNAVLLVPGFAQDRTVWAELASFLADRDYRTLAIDPRGSGDSEGASNLMRTPDDIVAAASYLRERDARRVVVIGAGAGATAALVAASGPGDFDGVITLSAAAGFMGLSVSSAQVAGIEEAKLFLAAEGDGLAQANAQAFYEAGVPPKRVEVLVGDDHGTELLEGREAEAVRTLILGFLTRYAP